MPLMGPRSGESELLDSPRFEPGELAESLGHLDEVNRWLGGRRALRHHLARLRRPGAAVRVVDVGTGSGALPEHLIRWARSGGASWTVVGVDRNAQIVRFAAARNGAGPRVAFVVADGASLPFPDRCFDAAVCTLTLHHFDDLGAVRLVREMGRVATRAVIVCDLERSLPNYLGARLLSATRWRNNRLTRADGPASVRRSFTVGELRRIGREAGLEDVRVRRHFPFRLVLDGRPAGGPGAPA